MAASSRFAAGDSIGWGIMGGVKEVPAGYQFETIVYHAKGINKVLVHNVRLLTMVYRYPYEIKIACTVTIGYLDLFLNQIWCLKILFLYFFCLSFNLVYHWL